MDNDELVVTIGAREIYDAIQHVSGQVSALVTLSTDHETRLRSLERRIWALPSAGFVLSALTVMVDLLSRR